MKVLVQRCNLLFSNIVLSIKVLIQLFNFCEIRKNSFHPLSGSFSQSIAQTLYNSQPKPSNTFRSIISQFKKILFEDNSYHCAKIEITDKRIANFKTRFFYCISIRIDLPAILACRKFSLFSFHFRHLSRICLIID